MKKILTLTIALLLGFNSFGQRVLIIYDVINTNTTNLKTALETAGFSVSYSQTAETGYNGSNPSTNGFDAIIHLNSYGALLPIAGQQALMTFVNNGGCYIGVGAPSANQRSQAAAMDDLILFNSIPQGRAPYVVTQVTAQINHPIAAAIPVNFTVNGGAWDATAASFSTNPSTVVMKFNPNYDAVVIRNVGRGKVVNFADVGNFSNFNGLSDANIQQIHINAIRWGTQNRALAFDGDDHVSIGNILPTGSYSKEAWIYSTNNSSSKNIISSESNPFWISGGTLYAGNGNAYMTVQSANMPINKWVHVAVTYDAGSGLMNLYRDGSLVDSKVSAQAYISENMFIGSHRGGESYFEGKIDEVKIYNAALTPAEIQADWKNSLSARPAALRAYYSFNQGIPAGDNTAITALIDGSGNNNNGTLNGFAKTNGNTTSNFVDSYAMVVPTATAPSNLAASGFTANWTAPRVGVVSNYTLEYATNASFTVNVAAVSTNALSHNLTNLKPGTTYYYRVSAVSGAAVGGYSNVIAATTTVLTPPGNALAFDGVDDYINVPANNSINFSGANNFSLEAWVKPTSLGTPQAIVFKTATASYQLQYWFWINESGSLIMSLDQLNGTGWGNFTSDVKVSTSKWTHVAAVKEGTQVRLYIDGEPVGATFTGSAGYNSANASLGALNVSRGGLSYGGLIDELRIWNTPRTAAEIKANSNKVITGFGSELVLYYDFDSGSASSVNTTNHTVYDQTAYANNGTLVNFNLNGGTTSNWVGSYAIVTPIAASATTINHSGFTANWTAPAVGSATSYILEYSTSATFTSNVASVTVNALTYTVTNLKPGTTYYYRVSAVSGAAVGGYSNVIAVPTTVLAPPGNALNFTTGTDYVSINSNSFPSGNSSYTIEAWIKPTNSAFFNDGGIIGWGDYTTANQSNFMRLGVYQGNYYIRHEWWFNTPLDAPFPSSAIGQWSHLAATFNNTTGVRSIYLNGQLISSDVPNTANHNVTSTNITIGKTWNNQDFEGSIDEVRVYNTARTQAEIQNDLKTATPVATGLVAAYNFDQGVAEGNNVGITTLYDQSNNGFNGTLNNFALTGTVSNWVGSYAMVVPTAITATTVLNTSIVANWTAPTAVSGTVSTYQLQYSTSPVFATSTTINNIANTVNSYQLTNLLPNTTYYYRVLAKSGTTEIGGYSNVVAATTTSYLPTGNALAFDKSSTNRVTVNATNYPTNLDSYTIEAWINPKNLTQGNATQGIIGWGNLSTNASNSLRLGYRNGSFTLHNYWYDNDITGNIPNISDTWNHVAASYNSVTNVRSLYLNGVLIASATTNQQHTVSSTNIEIGSTFNGGEIFNGSIDQLRVYRTARTALEIQSDLQTAIAAPTGLVAAYNFDQGIANGDNTTIVSVKDELNTAKGTLNNFAKTGTVSNFVGSNNYPMEAATATTASSVSTNSFVANWNPTTAISATTYELDVASDADFATILPAYSNTNTGNVTSFLVGGLTPGSTYYYRVRANSEYFGTAANSNSITVTGDKVDQTITLALTTNTLVYGDAAYALGASSTNSGIPLLYTTSDANIATVSTTGTVQILNAGAVTITVSQAGDAQHNAAATVTHNLVVMPKAITATAEAKSKTYGDSDPALTYTFTPTLAFSDTFTGSVTRTTGENVGSYAITQGDLALSNNYVLTVVPATLTINSKAILATAEAKSKTYGAADPALTYTFTPTLAFSDTFTGSVTRTTGENVGAYAITQGSLALSSNYTLTVVPATLTINSKAIVATAEAKSKTYGTADPALTYTFTPTLAFSDTFTGSVTRTTGENVGAYAITQGSLALSSNYALTVVPATLTINSRAIVATAESKSKTYGNADPALTYTFTPTLAFSDTFTGSVTRTTGENTGVYAITQGDLALSSNYALTVVPATLTINSKAIVATAESKSKTYGNADPALTYTFSPTLAFSDTFTGSVTRTTGENVGAYAITQGSLALSSNYALTVVPATLTINSKSIAVTAESKSKTYGAADPALTYTFTPTLAFSDTFTGSVTRTTGENVGTYAITQGTLGLNGNYVLSYSAANLTITPKALTITADNKSRLQGVANPTLTVSYAGFITGQNNSNALSTQPNITTTANVASLPGNYPITASAAVAANGNYAISYVGGTMTVNQAAVTSVGLAATSLFENRPAGTVAGTLSSTSTDPAATFTYTLVTGTGSTDNSRFTISGNQIVTAGPLDFEAQSGYAIRVRSTTQFGLTLEQTFTINILDVNEAPTLDAVANQTVCYTTAVQQIALTGITPGPEANQALAMTIATNNPGLFRSLSITKGNGTAGTFSYGISNGWSGTAIVTVTLKDDGGTANNGNDTFTRTFNITVNPLPVVNIVSSVPGNSVSKGESLQLTANAPGAASYSWSNANGIISGQNTATLTIRPTQTTTYTVTALNATGCSESKQITIEVRSDFFAVKANNILTPNGDGANDTWIITNIDQYPNAEVKVFDRAGRIVFSKKGYDNSWNGSFNGTPLNEGAYLYVIDFGPGLYKAKGTVTILQSR